MKWESVEKLLVEWTGNIHFCTICDITFLVSCPWKSNVVLQKSFEKSLKNGCNFLCGCWFTNISTSHIHFHKLKPISGLYEFNVAIANSLYITCNFEVILLIWMFLVFQAITVKMVTGKWEDDILEKLSQKFNTIFFLISH